MGPKHPNFDKKIRVRKTRGPLDPYWARPWLGGERGRARRASGPGGRAARGAAAATASPRHRIGNESIDFFPSTVPQTRLLKLCRGHDTRWGGALQKGEADGLGRALHATVWLRGARD